MFCLIRRSICKEVCGRRRRRSSKDDVASFSLPPPAAAAAAEMSTFSLSSSTNVPLLLLLTCTSKPRVSNSGGVSKEYLNMSSIFTILSISLMLPGAPPSSSAAASFFLQRAATSSLHSLLRIEYSSRNWTPARSNGVST